jgi:5-(hydroxymethyl)furfural/furfural oxidase
VLSPALLLRSGIGPGEALRKLGVPVIADLPGVGRNLQNHPALNVTSYLPLGSMQPLAQRAVAQNCLRFSSNRTDCEPHDMGMVVFNRTAWHPLGRRIGSVSLSVYRPYSIGAVDLDSSDPTALPRIRFNTLDDPRDFERMVDGLKLMLDLLTDPAVTPARRDAFLPDPKIVARFGKRTAWNWARTLFVAGVLDIGPLRRALLGDSLLDLAALRADEDALRDYVRLRTSVTHHVCGTCRMGDPGDPETVTDSAGRVKGVAGLRVGDPSIFPVIPRGGMHIQAIMAAEKLADAIKSDLRA